MTPLGKPWLQIGYIPTLQSDASDLFLEVCTPGNECSIKNLLATSRTGIPRGSVFVHKNGAGTGCRNPDVSLCDRGQSTKYDEPW